MNIPSFAGLVIVTPPASEPITLAQALAHIREVSDSGGEIDTYVTALITAARQWCEAVLRRALLTQTWKLSLNGWPGHYIKLPNPPLQSVTSVSYRDSAGVVQTMAAAAFDPAVANSYNVNINVEPGRIVLPYSGIWPTDILMPGAAIEITYVAGFKLLADQSSPPTGQTFEYWEGYHPVRHAIKMIIGYWYENRIPGASEFASTQGKELLAAEILLQPYRVWD